MNLQSNLSRRSSLRPAAALVALLALSTGASARQTPRSTAREHPPARTTGVRTPFLRETLPPRTERPPANLGRPAAARSLGAPAPESVAADARSRSVPAGVDALPFAPLTEVHVTSGESGEIWARGRTYKASFGQDGATYVPFLGSDAPRNFPLSMRLVEARVGTRLLELERPRVTREDDRIVIDRGPVRAEYVPGLEAVEQLFVLDAPIAEPGDLALSLALQTELAARASGPGWVFEGAHGGVHYGQVVALDASGRRLVVPALVDQGQIDLIVPAAYLASASYPIAIDPLISTSTIDGSSAFQRTPDIAWDPGLNRFTVVFEEVFSATDRDVKLVQTDLGGNVVVGAFYADFSPVDARDPRVAVNQFGRRALVVYTTGPVGDRDIQGNLITLASSPSLSPRILISDNPEDLDLTSPDVGGDSYDDTANAFFTVVWQRIWDSTDSDIVMRQMTSTGGLLVEDLVTNFIGVSDEAPAISSCISPFTERHNLVWRREEGTGNTMVGAQYLFNGFPITPEFAIAQFSPDFPLSDPSVTAQGPYVPGESLPTYAVAFSVYYSTSGDSDVLLFVMSGDTLVSEARDAGIEHTELFDDQLRPSVATSGIGYAVVYEGAEQASAFHRSYLTSFTMANRDIAVRERRVATDLDSGDHFYPRICSTWESGGGLAGYGPYGAVSQALTTTYSDIVFGRYQGGLASGAQYPFCYGTPNSSGQRSLLTIDGYAGDTTSTRTVRVEGLPADRSGIFFTSQTTYLLGVIPTGSAGRLCLRNPSGRFPGIVNTGPSGFAEMSLDVTSLPIQGVHYPAIAGTTWYFQFWHRDTVAGLPTSNFSNAAGIPFH